MALNRSDNANCEFYEVHERPEETKFGKAQFLANGPVRFTATAPNTSSRLNEGTTKKGRRINKIGKD